jgi:hypothetical protein
VTPDVMSALLIFAVAMLAYIAIALGFVCDLLRDIRTELRKASTHE